MQLLPAELLRRVCARLDHRSRDALRGAARAFRHAHDRAEHALVVQDGGPLADRLRAVGALMPSLRHLTLMLALPHAAHAEQAPPTDAEAALLAALPAVTLLDVMHPAWLGACRVACALVLVDVGRGAALRDALARHRPPCVRIHVTDPDDMDVVMAGDWARGLDVRVQTAVAVCERARPLPPVPHATAVAALDGDRLPEAPALARLRDLGPHVHELVLVNVDADDFAAFLDDQPLALRAVHVGGNRPAAYRVLRRLLAATTCRLFVHSPEHLLHSAASWLRAPLLASGRATFVVRSRVDHALCRLWGAAHEPNRDEPAPYVADLDAMPLPQLRAWLIDQCFGQTV